MTEDVSTVRTRVESMPPGQTRTGSEAWIDWAAANEERLDPLSTPPRPPDIPEPRADDLKPFLRHWSPYGPDTTPALTLDRVSRNVTAEKRRGGPANRAAASLTTPSRRPRPHR
ncbi:hypothetical protein GCM10010383_67910 [Streptomyces lomondensis]|uniref:Uncharacterized protein n=1 Tax=Streptomyces lomondensis TaxID=68229 RepID=A0ABQ2XQS7_9ACTN|nr:hypothetical protein GCM10010383_67910 [Streptomyces lomondensis]